MNKNDLVITRDNKLARIVYTYREDGVLFAAIRYEDGSNPQGQGALDPGTLLCEHRVKTGKVVRVGGDYWNDADWVTERGLRRATPYNLAIAGLAS